MQMSICVQWVMDIWKKIQAIYLSLIDYIHTENFRAKFDNVG